uniref:RNase H type-1 domain-containing protein n=1 Tax=Chelydra serpentina TaxID=8475 RepID=A0A8T1SPL0_CHESE|nr:hypothetical protein G0U57_002770 [Chelydra serpentina]
MHCLPSCKRGPHRSSPHTISSNWSLNSLNVNLTFALCGPLNPATLLPDLPVPPNSHDCMEVVSSVLRVREDLFDVPLANPDLIFFMDGSSFYSEGQHFTGYTLWDVIEPAFLPANWGAQAAELYALARACQLATGITVSIYTDSHYAFGVIHCHRKTHPALRAGAPPFKRFVGTLRRRHHPLQGPHPGEHSCHPGKRPG